MNTFNSRPYSRFAIISLAIIVLSSLSGCASIKESWGGLTSKSAAVTDEPKIIESITIQFSLESAVLDANAKAAIKAMGMQALEHAPATLRVNGYTDVTGSEVYNKKLSIQRAMAVKLHLESLALKGIQVMASGEGETSPVADNSARTGRQKNRRAELVLLKP